MPLPIRQTTSTRSYAADRSSLRTLQGGTDHKQLLTDLPALRKDFPRGSLQSSLSRIPRTCQNNDSDKIRAHSERRASSVNVGRPRTVQSSVSRAAEKPLPAVPVLVKDSHTSERRASRIPRLATQITVTGAHNATVVDIKTRNRSHRGHASTPSLTTASTVSAEGVTTPTSTRSLLSSRSKGGERTQCSAQSTQSVAQVQCGPGNPSMASMRIDQMAAGRTAVSTVMRKAKQFLSGKPRAQKPVFVMIPGQPNAKPASKLRTIAGVTTHPGDYIKALQQMAIPERILQLKHQYLSIAKALSDSMLDAKQAELNQLTLELAASEAKQRRDLADSAVTFYTGVARSLTTIRK